ncbi:MAG TPA: family 1 glycosylhydrolase, partial [Candidatus Saccharimonadales bacterium]|nr:family 1 glycosylhydrolase [Candidatus Saccharimonadales bacterium]
NHWQRWPEDLDLMAELGLSTYRFSGDWSRAQPTPDRFDYQAMRQFAAMVEGCHDRGITPMFTYHHYTDPTWVDWEQAATVNLFANYVRQLSYVFASQGVELPYALVINEPEVKAGLGYAPFVGGIYPPQKKSARAYLRVDRHLAEAHKRGYDIIKQVYPDAQVASAISNVHYQPASGRYQRLNRQWVKLYRWLSNYRFHDRIQDYQDFIALNHYMHCVVDGLLPPSNLFQNPSEQPRSDLGWFLNPGSMYHVLMELHRRYRKPIVITENGLATNDDRRRVQFITDTLTQVGRAMAEGVDVRGYLHWTLFGDVTWEWDKGFWPDFGLTGVDPRTQERSPRPSAHLLGNLAKTKALNVT